jgi:hypothetical protein
VDSRKEKLAVDFEIWTRMAPFYFLGKNCTYLIVLSIVLRSYLLEKFLTA